MTQFLPTVPQTWWPGNREETNEVTHQTEPTVKANVAILADSGNESDAKAASVDLDSALTRKSERNESLSSSRESVTAHSPGRVPFIPSEDEQRTAARQLANANAIDQNVLESGEDQLERLKAALNDDAQRTSDQVQIANFSGDAKRRVDSLLGRARRLFDVGRLNEARQTAQIAQQLGETARLDYSPDEERPIDLVHRIDDQLMESNRPSSEPEADPDGVAEVDRSNAAEASVATQKPAETDNTGGRSWLMSKSRSVFRRDRKTPSTDVSTKPTVTDTESPHISLGLELGDDSRIDSQAAIVQANRSVALSPLRPTQGTNSETTPPKKIRSDEGEQSRNLGVPIDDAESGTEVDSESGEAFSPGDTAVPLLNDATEDTAIEDQATDSGYLEVSPPALEEVRPISPFRNVAKPTKATPIRPRERNDGQDSIWGWAVGIVSALVCSVFALACYRRGAT